MTAASGTSQAQSPYLIVSPLQTNVFAYLWLCAQSAKYVPVVAKIFVMNRYRSTILGWWWIVIRALLPTLGIVAVFQHIPSLNSTSLPYGLYVVSGMLLWTGVSNAVTYGTRSLKQSRRLHFRIAIPKLVFVASSTAIPAINMAIFAVAVVAMLIYEYLTTGVSYVRLSYELIFLPVPILFCFILLIGITSFTSTLFLFARDARMAFGLIIQLWFYFTPVIYTLDVVPERLQLAILYLNPMTALIDMVRWSLFGVGQLHAGPLAASIAISLAVFLLGARFVMRSEWVMRELV